MLRDVRLSRGRWGLVRWDEVEVEVQSGVAWCRLKTLPERSRVNWRGSCLSRITACCVPLPFLLLPSFSLLQSFPCPLLYVKGAFNLSLHPLSSSCPLFPCSSSPFFSIFIPLPSFPPLSFPLHPSFANVEGLTVTCDREKSGNVR